jgi:hypothetical protein
MFAVMKQAPDTDRTCTVLEYMAFESTKRLLPAYYEELSVGEGIGVRILDLIRKSVYLRWTALYSQTLFDPSGMTWDPCTKMLDEMLQTGNFNSVQKMYRDAAQKSIDDCFYRIKNIE